MYGIDPDIPAGFRRFNYEVVIESQKPDRRIAEIHESVARPSPLLDDLARSLHIDGTRRRQAASAGT